MQHTSGGKDLTDADALSRAPNEKPSAADQLVEEEIRAHVNLITNNIPASADRLEEIRDHTQQDITLQTVIEYIHKGWPTQKKLIATKSYNHTGMITKI